MKTTQSLTPTPVLLSEAFWPLFFTSKVMVRFVGSYICFGVADAKNRHLIVYAHDVARSLAPPTFDALARAFPLRNPQARPYKGPEELPVPYREIGSVRNVLSYHSQQGPRHISLLLPTDRVPHAQEHWLFVQWSRPDQQQVGQLLATVGQSRIHVIEKNALEMRVLVRLQPGEKLVASRFGFHYQCQTGLDFMVPVGAESCTA